MLSEAEQLCIGFLADARNDIACHAERSEASMSGFLADTRNNTRERAGNCEKERWDGAQKK